MNATSEEAMIEFRRFIRDMNAMPDRALAVACAKLAAETVALREKAKAGKMVLAVLAAVAIGGCTTAEIESRADGSYTAKLTRVLSDVALVVQTNEAFLHYSSDAEALADIGARLRASE